MTEPSLDDQIKVAQLKKLQAETAKVKAETSKLWIEVGKLSISVFVGLGIGLFTQATKVDWATQEKIEAVSSKEAEKKQAVEKKETEMLKDSKESYASLKKELTWVTGELVKLNPDYKKKSLVYVQFYGRTTRSFIDELRNSLQQNYKVPGAQRVWKIQNSEVRYFVNSDKEKAVRIAEQVMNFYKTKNCELNLPVKYVKMPDVKYSAVEVWLSDDDFCNNSR
ncbi:MAG: hypothetical protein OEZ39_07880 [Gammaproteobacteria bacterium]|nr:hypothetical protein [Gammaproteobacteria bacterium]